MITKGNMSGVFFTSDTHFWHTNIIKYCNRPFNSVEEMNEKLIQNWNNKVPKDGLVYHLGDFCLAGPTKARNILEQLNGKIILIKGNHDYKSTTKLFDEVYDQVVLTIENKTVYLNHFPFMNFLEESIEIFGHIHSINHSIWSKNQYDVGVDNNNYTPVSWEDIKIINKWT